MKNSQALETIFSQSRKGCRCTRFPKPDVPAEEPLNTLLPPDALAAEPLPLPELAEIDIVRHYSNLAGLNMSVDTNFYPLGSCTMKYNPKRNETLAASPKLQGLHPLQSEQSIQGQLAIFYELQTMLAEITGLPAVSLQPAAGAHGELTGLLAAAKYFKEKEKEGLPHKTTVLIPDSAHGTNPASAAFAGFKTVQVKSNAEGTLDLDDLDSKLNENVAVIMFTNPNTLGLFENNFRLISEKIHNTGGLVYQDGANLNAIAGIVRPGDIGADIMHINVHKTFSTPHGAGGPGAGPVAVRDFLAPFLPSPLVAVNTEKSDKERTFYTLFRPEKSIGKVRSFFGSSAILNRAWFYLRTLGAEGVRRMTENAVLNANYILSLLKDVIEVPYSGGGMNKCGMDKFCMHEFVASGNRMKTERNIAATDIAKRLIDYGIHPPTIYFPLLVKEAMMVEPTETESRRTLEYFAGTLKKILTEEALTDAGSFLHNAPYETDISRPDEVAAAKNPVLVKGDF